MTDCNQRMKNFRHRSRILPLRQFHNKIKGILIQNAVDSVKKRGLPVSLFDISVGRMGDGANWSRAGITSIFGIDPDRESIGVAYERYKNMKYPKMPHNFHELLPKEDTLLMKPRISKEGEYSITRPKESLQLAHILMTLFPDLLQRTIVDGTGGMGGDTIRFAMHCKHVNVVENNNKHMGMLTHNVKCYNLDNVTTHLGNIEDVQCDTFPSQGSILYIDPPWGGKHYQKRQKMLFVEPFHSSFINEQQQYEAIVIKIPFNFDIEQFKRGMNKQIWTWNNLYILYKFNILVFMKKKPEKAHPDFRMYMKPLSPTGTSSPFAVIKVTDQNSNKEIEKVVNDSRFSIVSCQFSFQYFFESSAMVHQALSVVSKRLLPGGVFIGTTIDGDKVMELLSEKTVYDEGFLFVKRESPFEGIFGNAYEFKIRDTQSGLYFEQRKVIEYLVYFSAFIEIAESYGLTLLNRTDFDEWAQKISNTMSEEEKKISSLNFSFLFEKNLDT